MSEKERNWSPSVWTSLCVKSLRMGWPVGIEVASCYLSMSKIKSTLMCGVFEDIFPSVDDLPIVAQLIANEQWAELCEYETHHGRGYTERFCDMKDEAIESAKRERSELFRAAKDLGVSVPPRALNCVYTWLRIYPEDKTKKRSLDTTMWTSMPTAMVDGHTREGRWARRKHTVLSGSYVQHREIGKIVMREGWQSIRDTVHGDLQ